MMLFFEAFNYITIRDSDEKEYKIGVDFLIDEEGNFRNPYHKINIGEQMDVVAW